MDKREALKLVIALKNKLEKAIRIKEIYLFGSIAKDQSNENSDIDVAIVSDNFTGNKLSDKKLIRRFVLETDYNLDVFPFRTDKFNTDNPYAEEVLKTGIKVT